MNKLSKKRKVQAINALCNGMGLRATSRVLGISRKTIGRLLIRVGGRCAVLNAEHMQGPTCDRINCDEIWSFVLKKQGRLRGAEKDNPELGSQFLFLAADPHSKAIVSWYLGKRTYENCHEFMYGYASPSTATGHRFPRTSGTPTPEPSNPSSETT